MSSTMDLGFSMHLFVNRCLAKQNEAFNETLEWLELSKQTALSIISGEADQGSDLQPAPHTPHAKRKRRQKAPPKEENKNDPDPEILKTPPHRRSSRVAASVQNAAVTRTSRRLALKREETKNLTDTSILEDTVRKPKTRRTRTKQIFPDKDLIEFSNDESEMTSVQAVPQAPIIKENIEDNFALKKCNVSLEKLESEPQNAVSSVKKKVEAYEKKVCTALLDVTLSPVKQKGKFTQTIVPNSDQLYVTTLSPVVLKSPEKAQLLVPRVVLSPLQTMVKSDKKENNGKNRPRNSIVNAYLRQSITRPSMRKSLMMLEKVKMELQLKESQQRKIPKQTEENCSPLVSGTNCAEKTNQVRTPLMERSNFNGINTETVVKNTTAVRIVSNKENESEGSDGNEGLDIIIGTPTTSPKPKFSVVKKIATPVMKTHFDKNSKKLSQGHITRSRFNKKTGGLIVNGVRPINNKIRRASLMKKLQEQKAREAIQRRNELLKAKMEEKKRKNEERMQHVQEIREQCQKEQNEKLTRIKKELDERNRLREETLKRAQKVKERPVIEKKELSAVKSKEKEQLKIGVFTECLDSPARLILKNSAQEQITKQHNTNENPGNSENKVTQDSKPEVKNLPEVVARCLNETFNAENKPCIEYEITPERPKIRKPSRNSDNYDISDLKSDQSTDDESDPRKTVPAWAQGHNLRKLILAQEKYPPNLRLLFPDFPFPDLSKIFSKKNKKRFHTRTSSAIWNSPIPLDD